MNCLLTQDFTVIPMFICYSLYFKLTCSCLVQMGLHGSVVLHLVMLHFHFESIRRIKRSRCHALLCLVIMEK